MTAHKKFHLQRRTNSGLNWYEPRDYDTDDLVLHADSITELRDTLLEIADRRTFTWSVLYRIITRDGEVVESYAIKPGVLRKRRSKS